MSKWLRRIRGAIGIGLTWAFAWFGAGMVLLLIGFRADVPFPLGFGFFGFLAGVTFSGVLGIVERRHRFDQLSLPRFAAWGCVGGLLLSGIFVPVAGLGAGTFLVLGPVFALSSAGCAAGSLAIARMAEDRELAAGADVNEAGLTEDEVRELLGDGSFLTTDPYGDSG